MKRALSVLAGTMCLAGLLAAAPVSQPEVTVSQGALRGVRVDGGVAFKGIPFAAPPVGALRWRPPAPAPHWEGVREATDVGPSCAQEALGWNDADAARGAEDCLTLNIWTPDTAKAKRPVMVWIHGGAFAGGSGSSPYYDAAALMRHGVVVVTINYRLGVLGFFAHPGLAHESPQGASGNYGYMDQIAALRWVKDNIGKFGGDPDNVTAFGQSAGSISISTLMASPRAKGLFHRAILESGTVFGIGRAQTLAESEKVGAALGDIETLRQEPADELIKRWQAFEKESPETRRAWPTIDGWVVREDPALSLLKGAGKSIEVMVGSNAREFPMPLEGEKLEAAIVKAFGDDSSKAEAFYLPAGVARAEDPLLGIASTQFAADVSFRCPSMLGAQTAGGAWLYHFEQPLPGAEATGHSHEVLFVFGNGGPAWLLKKPMSDADRVLSDEMQRYWTNFARAGDPNGKGLAHWPRYQPGSTPYLSISESQTTAKDHLRSDICPVFVEHWSNPNSYAYAH